MTGSGYYLYTDVSVHLLLIKMCEFVTQGIRKMYRSIYVWYVTAVVFVCLTRGNCVFETVPCE
jgi:hypothetical protein